AYTIRYTLESEQNRKAAISVGLRPAAQVQGIVAMGEDFCADRVQASVVTATSARMPPLAPRAEGVPHDGYDCAAQSRGPCACGAGGDTPAPWGRAPRDVLPAPPRPCPHVWPWRGGSAPGDARWPSCALSI